MDNSFEVERGKISAAAEDMNYHEVSRLLRRTKDISSVKKDIQMALLIAAARDDVLTGYGLIRFGADVNYGAQVKFDETQKNNDVRPPIFNAVECGSASFLQLLLSRGAIVNIYERRGYTPIVAAYYYCKTEEKAKIITLLLAAGADPFLGYSREKSFADIYYKREQDATFHTDFEREWCENWKTIIAIGNSYEMFSLYGRFGIRKNSKVLIPPYFIREHFNYIPGATYLFVSDKMDNWLNEVILLDNANISNESIFEIRDGYSTTAPMWYFDDSIGAMRVYDHSTNGVIRIFNNGIYYLYNYYERRKISYGYSYIDDIQKDMTYAYVLGNCKGRLDIYGREMSFSI